MVLESWVPINSHTDEGQVGRPIRIQILNGQWIKYCLKAIQTTGVENNIVTSDWPHKLVVSQSTPLKWELKD